MDGNSSSSPRMLVKLEELCDNAKATGQINSQSLLPMTGSSSASFKSPQPSQTNLYDEIRAFLEPADNSDPILREESITSAESFVFKTPTAIGPTPSTTVTKSSTSGPTVKPSLKSVRNEPAPNGQKSPMSSKKHSAAEIAPFVRASSVDRLDPSTLLDFASKISNENLNSRSSSMSSQFSIHPSMGVSKQLTTQTMLPTPALNAALRSFFNFSTKSEGSPSTDSNHSDDDEDVEEEEILVYMQFDSKLDSDLLQPHTPFKIIGVDSEKPVLQLGNQVFEGKWTDTTGTSVFFEENPSVSPGDPVFMKNPPLTLNYHSKTQKALVMSRIFVRPKQENDSDGASNSDTGPMVPMAIVEVAP